MSEDTQREFTRISVELLVSLRVADGSTVAGTAVDLSLNGIRCRTAARPPVGARCTMELGFGDADEGGLRICGEGHIARHHDDGVAVAIDALELDSHDHLRKLILYNAVDPDSVEDEFASHLGLHRYPEPSEE